MVIVVGDTDEELARYAKSLYSTAVFVGNVDKYSEHIYGSLGDVSEEMFVDLLLKANCIIYHNKSTAWTSEDLKQRTQQLLYDVQKYVGHCEIQGLDFDSINLNPTPLAATEKKLSIKNHLYAFDFDNFLGLKDHRKIHSQQLWTVGCSFAHGVALNDKNQRYGQLVADHYKLPASFLTLGGTSIDWAADQILRADIKSGDIVIWGITGVNRASWFDQAGKYFNLSFSFLGGAQSYELRRASAEEKLTYFDIITNDSRLYLSVRSVAQVRSHCAKIGAHLIMIMHPELSKAEHASVLVDFLKQTNQYLDLGSESDPWVIPKKFDDSIFNKLFPFRHRKYKNGSDNTQYYKDLGEDYMHPGPLMHQEWANKIIDYIRDKKWINEKY